MTLGVACYIPGEGFVRGEWGAEMEGREMLASE